MPSRSVNPANGQVMKTFDNFTDEQVESALAGAYAVYRSDWSRGPMVRRLQVLSRLAERIDERAEELARIITLEMGKRIGEARREVAIIAGIARFYAKNFSPSGRRWCSIPWT